jgi:hypothetical protein
MSYETVNGPQPVGYGAPLVDFSALSGGQSRPQQTQQPGTGQNQAQNPWSNLGAQVGSWLKQWWAQNQQQQQPGQPTDVTPPTPTANWDPTRSGGAIY